MNIEQKPLPLLITDVMMPGFSGPVLAERLGAARPETKVLNTSGFTDGTFVTVWSDGIARFLRNLSREMIW